MKPLSKLNISKASNHLLVKLKPNIKIQRHDLTEMVKCMDIQWEHFFDLAITFS